MERGNTILGMEISEGQQGVVLKEERRAYLRDGIQMKPPSNAAVLSIINNNVFTMSSLLSLLLRGICYPAVLIRTGNSVSPIRQACLLCFMLSSIAYYMLMSLVCGRCNSLKNNSMQRFHSNEVGHIECEMGHIEYLRMPLMGLFEYFRNSTGNRRRILSHLAVKRHFRAICVASLSRKMPKWDFLNT